MSMDFTIVFAAPDRAIGSVLIDIDSRLKRSAYRCSGAIVRAGMDASRGVFDEIDTETDAFRQVTEVAATLDEWPGAAVEYLNQSVGTMYLLLGRQRGEYLNVWVDVAERQLRRAIHEDKARVFYRALAAIAGACHSDVGIGDLEIPFKPRRPQELKESLNELAHSSSRSNTQVFLFRDPKARPAELEPKWGEGAKAWRFDGGYWVVETLEYRQFWSL